jgi:hypothetical protein
MTAEPKKFHELKEVNLGTTERNAIFVAEQNAQRHAR